MLLLDTWRLWKALYREGGLLITTADAEGVGVRTLLQADGDMVIGVSASLSFREDLVRRHTQEVAQALSILPRLHQALRRYGTLHISVGWHTSGSLVGYTLQSLGPHPGGAAAARVWFPEGSVLLSLALAVSWGVQYLLGRWLGAAHAWWVTLLTSAGPLVICSAVWGYQRWRCGLAPCPAAAAMAPVLLPLLFGGALSALRLLFQYGVRRYIRSTFQLG